MQRNNVFSRYYQTLDEHLPYYIHGDLTLAETTKRIIEELNKLVGMLPLRICSS